MDFLRNIASAALQSSGITFPFSIGEKVDLGANIGGSGNIWDIREGVKKDDGTLLTLFIFDSNQPPLQPGNRDRKQLFHLAKNALKKLRTIRHPDVLKYIDSVETETAIYIATERVQTLEAVLSNWDSGKAVIGGSEGAKRKTKNEWIAWGIKSLATAVAFLNAPPLSQHHSFLLPSSIFVTSALEWRLGGFELLTSKDDQSGVLWAMASIMPGQIGHRCPPEVQKSGWGVLRDSDPAFADTYLLALLIFTIYNPHQPLPQLTTAPQPSQIGAIPRTLFPLYKRMLNPNPRTRLPTTQFVDEVTATGFWSGNTFIDLVEALDSFQLASDGEKLAILRQISQSVDSIPPPFLASKVLPSLLHSLSLPGAPASAMLPLVLSIGKELPPDRYRPMVLEPVCKLYASPDRGTRMALLDGLGEYDTVAVIREATVKAIPVLAPKLSERLLNNDLLRLLAKMQVDPEPSIRTNTCILLGRLAPLLNQYTRKKVLVPAFARSLKDSFVHARVAGLMALMATVEFFDKEDLAGRVIPNMSFTLVDKEKLVRDQAFKAMQMYMGQLEKAAAEMPDSVLPEGSGLPHGSVAATTTLANGSAGQGGLVNTATGAAGALAGWAIASLGKQLPSNEAHSKMAPASSMSGVPAPRVSVEATTPQANGVSRQTFDSSESLRPVSTFKSKPSSSRQGMQLGSSKSKQGQHTDSVVDMLAGEFEEDGDEVANAWGTDDLIDVNADTDDWSAFETAPTPLEPPRQPSPPRPKTSANMRSAVPAPGPSSRPITPRPPQPVSKPVAPAAEAATAGWGDNDAWGDVPSRTDGVSSPAPSASGASEKTNTVSLAGLSKEEKEKEMARRREERKAEQRIAAMKEQKKGKP